MLFNEAFNVHGQYLRKLNQYRAIKQEVNHDLMS